MYAAALYHPLVFADLDPELHSLQLCVPTSIFGEGEKHARLLSPDVL